MEIKEFDCVAAFDTLYTTNHIQILKVLLSHLPAEQSGDMAVFIKFMELQHALSYSKSMKGRKPELNICSRPDNKFNLPSFLEDIQNYCTESERQRFKKIKELFKTMDMYQEMQGFMEMMPALSQSFGGSQSSGDGDGSAGSGIDMSALLKNMLTPEQQAMFEMFQSGSGSEPDAAPA